MNAPAPSDATAPAAVHPGAFLTLHYRLAGPQGDIVNTFEGGQPSTLTLGTGALSPALEQRLMGMQEGQRACFSLAPGEAFGEKNPQMQQWVARKLLDEQGDPEDEYTPGEVVEFLTPSGDGSYAGTVMQVREDGAVLFDFSHPLAGQPVSFEVLIIGVL
ncbi:peptidylprolyl isomerase [Allofranklinella schreckenbergeri]|uniref:Peptidyl-prolyl cis-trans isomerase n=1 Tax=Allofranklinella schreckenbergeri TaxID=1076744 RepID=A0A3M6Q9U8_9BURK|nr:FKBP-type peptidyl-prolyl cis-trans isomerase [Allofranklinella schreckenbergeri]RMW97876.1 peptidylprolyl isomerase [Allofranklinella schreckenbergeri]RMW99955.1 peptidylprolyl isomerase [Allofranklinella schreckenbergeri]RMX07242.1 peptidylprolyl isomerase [Allofranklinella schreckenbergeri]RRD43719.1 peptidylprolyl isomerase [Comamonadaceae bacterium OH3737_COT-264]